MTQFDITLMSNLSLTLKYLNRILTTKDLHLNCNNLKLHDNFVYLNVEFYVPMSTSSISNQNLFFSKLRSPLGANGILAMGFQTTITITKQEWPHGYG